MNKKDQDLITMHIVSTDVNLDKVKKELITLCGMTYEDFHRKNTIHNWNSIEWIHIYVKNDYYEMCEKCTSHQTWVLYNLNNIL